eukprot:scpid17623/ scgid4963/ 
MTDTSVSNAAVSPQHWVWAECSNAVLADCCSGESCDSFQPTSRAKALACWQQYRSLLRTIEGLPCSPTSVHCELLVRHNAAAVLLVIDGQGTKDSGDDSDDGHREVCPGAGPLHGGLHVALHVLGQGLNRALKTVSASIQQSEMNQDHSVGAHFTAGSAARVLNIDSVAAIARDDVAAMVTASTDIFKAVKHCTKSEDAIRLLAALLTCVSAITYGLQLLPSDHGMSQSLFQLGVDILGCLGSKSPTRGKDEPHINLIGEGLISFWSFPDLKFHLSNMLCSMVCVCATSSGSLSALRKVCNECFGEGEHQHAELIFLEAWLLCRKGEAAQCIDLLDSAADTLRGHLSSQANLLGGICRLLMGEPHRALLKLKASIVDNVLHVSILAMLSACHVFKQLRDSKSEVQSWKHAAELYAEYSNGRSACCDFSHMVSFALSGTGHGGADQRDTSRPSLPVLPALAIHRRLHRVSVHLSVPHHQQLLHAYAQTLLSRHSAPDSDQDDDTLDRCTSIYSRLLQAMTKASSLFTSQVFCHALNDSAAYSMTLLEYAAALRDASQPEDSTRVCLKLLSFCSAHAGSQSAKLGIRVVNEAILTVSRGGDCFSKDTGTVTSRKRKHEISDSTSEYDPNHIQIQFLESAAWLCRALNLRAMRQVDEAVESLRNCIATLEDLPPLSVASGISSGACNQTTTVKDLYTVKAEALYTLADVLHDQFSTDNDHRHVIKEHLQNAIACCTQVSNM